jgi:hypothetical protein
MVEKQALVVVFLLLIKGTMHQENIKKVNMTDVLSILV